MADTIESREALRRRLRGGVIEGNSVMREGKRKPSLLVYIIAAVVLLITAAGLMITLSGTTRGSYTVDWQITEAVSTGSVGHYAFNGGIISLTKDGAAYFDRDGHSVWDRSYQMSSPICDVCGDYAAIADQGATRFYIFSTEGQSGVCDTLLPISMVRVSALGVVYAVLNDSDASYIAAFDRDGTALDLSVKSILTGDGYPFDMDVSPDGTELITSYLSITDGELVNTIVFRNFSSVGQNEDARRVVGGFSDEVSGHIAGGVRFSTDEYSEAFYDGGVIFFSTRVLNSPEVLANIEIPARIMSVASGDKIAAVFGENDADTEDAPPYKLRIFNIEKGSLRGEAETELAAGSLVINGDTVVISDKSRILVYSAGAREKADLSFDEGPIAEVVAADSSRALYVVSATSIYRIRF